MLSAADLHAIEIAIMIAQCKLNGDHERCPAGLPRAGRGSGQQRTVRGRFDYRRVFVCELGRVDLGPLQSGMWFVVWMDEE